MVVLRAGLVVLCLMAAACVAVIAARFCEAGGRAAQILARQFCRIMLRLLRIRVEVSGPLPQSGQLLVSNHVSWIDPLVLLAVTPAAVLAKREVGTWPAIGALARLQATVFVDRRRRRCIPQVNRDLADRLGRGRTVLLFPEGTTHDGQRRGHFHTSHLACLAELMRHGCSRKGAIAQAVALSYSRPEAAWIGDDTLLPHLWLTLRRPGLTCRVAFAMPQTVHPGYNRKSLGRSLAADVEDLLEAPETSQDTHKRWEVPRPQGLIVTRA